MNFKKNADANRDALFGGVSTGNSKKKSSSSRAAPQTSFTSSTPAAAPAATTAPSTGYKYGGSKASSSGGGPSRPNISAEARAAKLKEAEENKEKANKAMQRSFFTKPDPVAASTYYKRAADCYQTLGDARLERYYRLSSGDCNMQCGAWASAASDFTRAADLLLKDGDDIVDPNQRRRDASNYHKKAAQAWSEMGEKAKAAGSQVEAAIALNYGQQGTMLGKEALAGIEEAIEAHVPDVFNPYAKYRQTGHSAFLDPNNPNETLEKPSQQVIDMAKEHMVSRSYAHEPLQQLVDTLVGFGEYPSALYATGAATAILEQDGISTLTLSRAFVVETILTLAMGDPILAEQQFLNRHVQKSAYLSSRECKLAEDLFRAIRDRDFEALDAARSPSGDNRTALANLNESLRELTTYLRVSGVARKPLPGEDDLRPHAQPSKQKSANDNKDDAAAAAASATSFQELMKKPTGYEQDVQEGEQLDANELANELDNLDFDGLGGSSDEEGGGDDDDDDLDLR